MYLLYLDASGSANPKDVNTKHYVYLGCPCRNRTGRTSTLTWTLKSRYRFPGEDFELHVKQFAVSMREQDKTPDFEKMGYEDRREAVRELRKKALAAEKTAEKREEMRKRFKGTDPFIHLTRERSQLLEDAVALIGSFDNIKLFADAVSKSHPGVTGGTVDPVIETFTQAITRFDTFLDKIAMKAQERDRRGALTTGCSSWIRIHPPKRNTPEVPPLSPTRTPIWQAPACHRRPILCSQRQGERSATRRCLRLCVASVFGFGEVMGSHEERQFLTIFRLFDRDPRGRLAWAAALRPGSCVQVLDLCGEGPRADATCHGDGLRKISGHGRRITRCRPKPPSPCQKGGVL